MYCGKYVPYDKRVTVVKTTLYWNGFYEDTQEDTEIYHKKCKPRKRKETK